MAQNATIYKLAIQLADMDRGQYGDHQVTLALHPSETPERLGIRALAYALNLPANNDQGSLEPSKGLFDADEPELWEKDLTGAITHWIDIGQPDDRRLMRASSRAGRVSVYAFAANTPVWWAGIQNKLTRARNLTVWQIPAEQSRALSALVQRGMQWQISVQDGSCWINSGTASVEVTPVKLMGPP